MSDNYYQIPAEIQAYAQWIVWKLEDREGTKPTKVPYSATTGRMASVTDPSTWATFEQAVACAEAQNMMYSGIGFVFTETDPFAGVDLDDTKGDESALRTQLKIFEMFNSYAERSPSGTGLHIICRGHIPNGRRRGSVELYSSDRFFTMTGDVYLNAPVRECQTLVSTLWHELGGHIETYVHGGDLVEKMTDAEIIEKASNAVNGEKFIALHTGDWQNQYPSQSEADQAYMNFLAFYSQHRTQLMRLFRQSPLGQREKAQRNGYLNYTINKAFDRMLPPIDLDGFRNAAEEAIAAIKAQNVPTPVGTPAIDLNGQIARALALASPATPAPVAAPIPAPSMPTKTKPIEQPPGLLGELSDFIYRSAPRPVPEIALAGAIGLMAGVCGRSYNVSATGLNMYLLLLAPTGTGKEAMQSGISKFMSYVERGGMVDDTALNTMPAVREFTGPAEISSGQALLRFIQKQRSFVSVVGEFGLTMQRLAHPRASSSDIMLKKVLLDLFNKSGMGSVLKPTIYSDKDKNTEDVLAPAFTLLGESTPESYFSNLDESLVADGLLPRILTITYEGKRPRLNNDHAFVVPSMDMVRRFCDLCDNSLKLNSHNQAMNVEYTPEAKAFLDGVEEYTTDQINTPDQRDAIRHLWNRAHLKTLKLAALVAIGCNPSQPIITVECAQWAYDLIERDVLSITRKFEMGEVGRNSEETKQVSDVIRVVSQYLTGSPEAAAKYGAKRVLHNARIIPYTYIQRRLAASASFRHDRIGATNAIKRTLQTMIDEGVMIEVGRADMDKHSARGKGYMIADVDRFAS